MQGRERENEVYSEKIRAGKRTYFFDVRATHAEDYYITITESKRRFGGRGYDKHKIFLYKEDFNKFQAALAKTVDHVKTELMPDYDYEEFDRRAQEYEERRAAGELNEDYEGEEDNNELEEISTRWED